MPEVRKGLMVIPGKRKTTVALGTALRAVGQGLKVLMLQFIKGSWHYGELDAAKMLGDDQLRLSTPTPKASSRNEVPKADLQCTLSSFGPSTAGNL